MTRRRKRGLGSGLGSGSEREMFFVFFLGKGGGGGNSRKELKKQKYLNSVVSMGSDGERCMHSDLGSKDLGVGGYLT